MQRTDKAADAGKASAETLRNDGRPTLQLSESSQDSPESELAQIGYGIYTRLVSAIRSGQTPNTALQNESEAIYIKATDGQIVLNNSVYDQYFSAEIPAIGRYAQTFLDRSVAVIARISDEMLIHGADWLEFCHSGLTTRGENVMMRTYKKSLLGVGHPRMAILGVTRIERILESNDAARLQTLADTWRKFERLDTRDQGIAIGIAQGKKLKELAKEMNVSEKTIENRRSHVYKTLDIDGPTELVKLLVRIQDNGFQDLGL